MVTFHFIYRFLLTIFITCHSLHAKNIQQLPPTFQVTIPTVDYTNSSLLCAVSGLGAKLSLAHHAGQHTALGHDLVAHCTNELIAHNAQPLFFATYFATDALEHQATKELTQGIVASCLQSKCPYVGTETEEIKKLLHTNQYVIGGFMVGITNQNPPTKEPIICGDVIIGLATSGIHASSFAAIQALIDHYNMDIMVDAPFVTMHRSLAHAILEPITIYTNARLSPCKYLYIKAMAPVTHGGLYTTVTQIIPPHVQAKIELYRWTIPPMLRWIKQIGKLDISQMAQQFNLGIGMVIIVHPFHAKTIIKSLQQKKINAFPIGIIEQRSGDAPPVTLTGTMGSTYSRVLIIGDTAQDHAFAWKLAQSPYIERIFITPGNGGTSTEQKVQNIFINPAHHGALIAYIQQNNIDAVIVTKKELLAQGIINTFSKVGIACIGPTKKVVQLATSPTFLQQIAIPMANNTVGTTIQYAIITDGITSTPLGCCQQYKKQYDNDTGLDTDGMGACCPAPNMSQKIEERILREIMQPFLDGLKAEGISFCGFLAADLLITPEGNPQLVQFHFDLGNCTAATILLRLQTDFFKLCYAACHQQLKDLPLVWDPLSAISVMLHNSEQQEIMVGLPENTPHAKVFHMHSLYKEGKYYTQGTQPLCVIALGETLEKARNNTYKLVQQIYWPGITYRHDIAYREITRQNR